MEGLFIIERHVPSTKTQTFRVEKLDYRWLRRWAVYAPWAHGGRFVARFWTRKQAEECARNLGSTAAKYGWLQPIDFFDR